MVLRTVKLACFRNLSGVFELSPKITVILGLNGKGKTNLLEAIFFLSTGKSFRTSSELSVIRKSEEDSTPSMFTRIEGNNFDELGNSSIREVIVEKVYSEPACADVPKKTLRSNGKNTSRSKFMKNFPSVIFSPNTIDIIAGSPSERRKDLDDFLSMYDEDYLDILIGYKNVVRQRNRLLEEYFERNITESDLKYWNEKLVELGSFLIYKRSLYFKEVNSYLPRFANNLFNHNTSHLQAHYESKFCSGTSKINLASIRELFKKKITENTQKEIRAGITLYGPQREDFSFTLDSLDLREFGSRGQQRLCAFSYKMCQALLLAETLHTKPVLLLDDLFSELDKEVHRRIQDFLAEWSGQIIMTGLHKNEFGKIFLGKGKILLL